MKILKLLAPAKLDLNLNIFPTRTTSGYFPMRTLKCQVELSDEIILEEKKRGIEIGCDNPHVPTNHDNSAFKAANLLSLEVKNKKGIKILIKKRIPITAGLAGGSTDAAATLRGLNQLWNLKLTKKKLVDIAAKIGMDVPHPVAGGLVLVSGIGDKVEKLPFSMPKLPVIIVTPKATKPSTAWAYQNVDLKKIGRNGKKLNRLIQAIKKKNIVSIGQNLHNDFEYSIGKKFPEVGKIKKSLLETGALGALMAGAGLSVFGIYQDGKTAQRAYRLLQKQYNQVFLTKIL